MEKIIFLFSILIAFTAMSLGMSSSPKEIIGRIDHEDALGVRLAKLIGKEGVVLGNSTFCTEKMLNKSGVDWCIIKMVNPAKFRNESFSDEIFVTILTDQRISENKFLYCQFRMMTRLGKTFGYFIELSGEGDNTKLDKSLFKPLNPNCLLSTCDNLNTSLNDSFPIEHLDYYDNKIKIESRFKKNSYCFKPSLNLENKIQVVNCPDLTDKLMMKNLIESTKTELYRDDKIKSSRVEDLDFFSTFNQECKNDSLRKCFQDFETRVVTTVSDSKNNVVELPLSIMIYTDSKNKYSYCCYIGSKKLDNEPCSKAWNFTSDRPTVQGLEFESHRPIYMFVPIDETEDCWNGRCFGDDSMCTNFGCAGVKNIYCQLDREAYSIMYVHDRTLIPIKRIDYTNVQTPMIRSLKGMEVREACLDCNVECKNNKLSFTTRDRKISKLKICSSNLCKFTSINSEIVEEHVPNSMIYDNSTIILYIQWAESEINSIMLVNCEGTVCNDAMSIFRVDSWANIHCYKFWQYGVITLLFVFSIIIFSILTYSFRMIFKLSKLTIFPPIKFVWYQLVYFLYWLKYKFVKSVKPRFVHDFNDLEVIVEKAHLIDRKPEKFSYKRYLGKYKDNKDSKYRGLFMERNFTSGGSVYNGTTYTSFISDHIFPKSLFNMKTNVLILLLILNPLTDACSEETTLIIEQNQCQSTANGNVICSITNSMRLAVSPVGQTSCFMLKNQGLIVGSLLIKTKSINLSCKLNSEYWAPQTSHDCHSAYNCHNAGYCSNDYRECNNPETYTDKIFGKMDGYKKWHDCKQNPTSSECFYNSGACFHTLKRLLIKNKDSIEVNTCTSWDYSVELTVTTIIGSVDETHDVVLTTSESHRFDTMKISLISMSIPPSIGFNKCFFRLKKSWFIGECNKRGEYSVGRIGEIQCPDKESSENSNQLNKCYADKSLIEIIYKNQFITCISRYLEVSKYLEEELPTNFGDYLIKVTNEVPSMVSKQGSLMELQVDLKKFSLTSKTDKNLCYARFISLTGCYSCPKGAIISLETNTNFGSATASFSCPSIGYKTIGNVINDVSITNLSLHVLQSSISSECFIECPGGSNRFYIKGTLEFLSNMDLHENNTVYGQEISTGGVDWKGIFGNIRFALPISITLLVIVIITISMLCTCRFNISKKIN